MQKASNSKSPSKSTPVQKTKSKSPSKQLQAPTFNKVDATPPTKTTDKVISVKASVLKSKEEVKVEEKKDKSKSPSSKVKAATVETKLKQMGLSKEKVKDVQSVAPKKPKTSFMFFSKEQNPIVR